jgi:hypothetical protein
MGDQATGAVVTGVTGDGVAVPATLEEAKTALAAEQAKNTVLLNEVVALEDEIVNRCMADFAGVVSDESREYWREQLLTNRKGATVALTELANAKKAGAPAAPAIRAPMHNRSTARPVAPAVVGGGGTDGDADGKAAKIRNRAHEICGAEHVPFSAAFRRAEREIGGQ